MEKKPVNNTGINKSLLRSLNRAYTPEPFKDENRISELTSIFSEGELDSIRSTLESNYILNFKDSEGHTLIHSIIKNESSNITEDDKLEIIKILVEKNVSINSMTQYNQNSLHYACQNGYVKIINYLITNSCEQELIDNYGNAPIHYLIDKFIVECTQNDFYKDSNYNVKNINSGQINKLNNIMKNQSLIMLFQLFDVNTEKNDDGTEKKYYLIPDGYKIINTIKKFIKCKTQNEIYQIYEIINNKNKEIINIFKDPGEKIENKFEKAKNIVLNIREEISKIYKFDLDSNTIIWENFIMNQYSKINEQKNIYKKNINENLINILNQLKYLKNYLNDIKKEYYNNLIAYTSRIYFIYIFISDNFNHQQFEAPLPGIAPLPKIFFTNDNDGNLKQINDENIFWKDEFNNQEEFKNKLNEILDNILVNKLIYKDTEIKIFINGIEDIDSIYVSNIPINIETFVFIDEYFNLGIPYCKGILDVSGFKYCYYLPFYDINKDKASNIIKSKNYFDDNEYINDEYLLKNEYIFKYSAINSIISFIKILIDLISNNINIYNIDNEFIDYIQKIDLFYIKNFTENMIKIINNLVILEKYIKNIDIQHLEETNKSFNKIFNELNDIYINNIDDDDYKDSYKDIIEKLKLLINKTDITNLIHKLNQQEYKKLMENVFFKVIKLFDNFEKLIKDINIYQSYIQLEKYNEYIKNFINKNINPISVENTIFNNYYYDIYKNFPKSFFLYQEEYFKIKDNINLYELGLRDDLDTIINSDHINLDEFINNINYKKKLIENIIPYVNTFNFNTFYLDKTKLGLDYKYNIEYYIVELNIERININNYFKIKIISENYNLDNYEFSSDIFKFSRGYNILKKDINNLEGKQEINILCRMKDFENKSDFENNSIKENNKIIATYNIEESLKIDKLELTSYIITTNLDELVNLLVYLIYIKLVESTENYSDCFFYLKTKEFDLINIEDNSDIIKKKIGIDLEDYEINETYKKNIIETLSFISVNNKEKENYLIDNIKLFVKIIITQEINKQILEISKNIKIKYPLSNNLSISENKAIIDILYKKKFLLNIENENKKKLSDYLTNMIKEFNTSSTLEFNEIIKTSEKKNDKKKIIDSKCLNKKKTDELINLNLNYRILDLNGNTIITRLIDQYNFYGIEKILNNKILLKTYKNYRNETPLDYLINIVSTLEKDYDQENFNDRINKYSILLEVYIKDNNEINGISIENTYDVIKEIILNSMYIFNEVMWLKLYDFPNGWKNSDKNELKDVLKIVKEELLINTIDDNDIEIYINEDNEKIINKILLYIKMLEEEIKELDNKINENNLETSESKNDI